MQSCILVCYTVKTCVNNDQSVINDPLAGTTWMIHLSPEEGAVGGWSRETGTLRVLPTEQRDQT